MRTTALFLLGLVTLGCGACADQRAASEKQVSMSNAIAPAAAGPAGTPVARPLADASPASLAAPLDKAGQAETPVQPVDRKVIRNADLAVELDDPLAAQRKVTTVAESNGGFVVTSDSQQQDAEHPTVTVTLRVPSAQFDRVLEGVRGLGGRVVHEKVTGQDVTEEYIDLEARIKSEQALEAQFLAIMKTADSVDEALTVQRQIADVRGEIEKLEGRRRFLENQSSLSTITVTLQPPAPIVASSGPTLGGELKRAVGDSFEVAFAILLGVIRFVGVALPVALFVCLPLYIVGRLVLRRFAARGPRLAAAAPPRPPAPTVPPSDATA